MGVCYQALHVWLQQRQEGVAEIAEQTLETEKKKCFFFFFIFSLKLKALLRNVLTLNKQNLRVLNLSLPFRSSRERNSMN